MKTRTNKGEVIGGGYFVFRRNSVTGRVRGATSVSLEHGTYKSAYEEADRLSKLEPGATFEVYERIETVRINNENQD
jgi:hypothetical protein